RRAGARALGRRGPRRVPGAGRRPRARRRGRTVRRRRGIEWVELKTFAPNRGAMEFWEELGFTPRVVQLTSGTRDLLDRLA
ncbi:MAG TPA: hypothetical protein VEC15_12345, partial [Actinomycetota bacterium]|nr:hypothetical protein [Actinomycetota bacterium]